MSTDRQLNIHTCECLLDHLVRLPYDEIEKYIINYVIFSLADKWLMFIHNDSEILFFCLDCLFIVRKFTYETIFSALRDLMCLMTLVWILLIMLVLITVVKIAFSVYALV